MRRSGRESESGRQWGSGSEVRGREAGEGMLQGRSGMVRRIPCVVGEQFTLSTEQTSYGGGRAGETQHGRDVLKDDGQTLIGKEGGR